MSNQIAVKVNSQNLLRNLGSAFTNNMTVVTELLQNSRRAGATKIELYVDGKKGLLVVVDDGHGISDFQNLLTIAESGWSEDIKEAENAFGMGFLACLYRAEHVTVKSKGKLVEIDVKDALGFENIEVKRCKNDGKTTVTLRGFDFKKNIHDFGRELTYKLRGFPVPVYFNAVEVDRSMALESLPKHETIKTPLGMIYMPGISEEPSGDFALMGYPLRYSVFLQGFPLRDLSYSRHDVRHAIVHLDSKVVIARMPDRDCLVDQEEVEKKIKESIRQAWLDKILVAKQELPPEVFVQRYYDLAKSISALSVFNDVDYLPSHAVSTVNSAGPVVEDDWTDNNLQSMGNSSDAISRLDIEAGKVVVCSLDDFNGNDYLYDTMNDDHAWFFVKKAGWLVLNNSIDNDHWIHKYVVDLVGDYERVGEGDCREAFKNLNPVNVSLVAVDPHEKDSFVGNYVGTDIVLCRAIEIKVEREGVLLGSVEISDEPVTYDTAMNHMATYVPDGMPGYMASAIPEMISSYRDDSESLDENARTEDSDSIRRLISSLRGQDPKETLAEVLNEGQCRAYKSLRGKAFVVTFDESGNPTITDAS
jgi:hypothetical protein